MGDIFHHVPIKNVVLQGLTSGARSILPCQTKTFPTQDKAQPIWHTKGLRATRRDWSLRPRHIFSTVDTFGRAHTHGTIALLVPVQLIHIHKHNFPLAVPAANQSLVGWNTATAGTAVMPSPPRCANCSPLAEKTSTNLFILPMQSLWTPSWG